MKTFNWPSQKAPLSDTLKQRYLNFNNYPIKNLTKLKPDLFQLAYSACSASGFPNLFDLNPFLQRVTTAILLKMIIDGHLAP